MSILNIQIGQPGVVGVLPRIVYINTNDTLGTVTTTGYLNHAVQTGYSFSEADMALVITKATPTASTSSVAWLEVQYVAPNWSLTATNAPGSVTLPTITNHIATYTNTLGALSEDPATAISGGNIQAGLSGTAGALISFPTTASKGSFKFAATANTGNTITTLTNAAMGQASVISIPDPGVASTNVILADSTGTQHMSTGSFEVDLGNLIAGSSGHAGTLTSYPTTASKGSFVIAAVNNTGNTTTTLSNAAMGQATVVSLPDPGVATTNVILADSAGTQHITTGSLSVDVGNIAAGSSGHAGTISSFPGTASTGSLILAGVANSGNTNVTISNASHGQATVYSIGDIGASTGGLVAATTALRMKAGAIVVVAGGAAAQTVTDTFCTTTSCVIANWNDTTNAVEIKTVAAGNGSFVVTSTADPGASHLNYIILK
jgi:hypothetical protein